VRSWRSETKDEIEKPLNTGTRTEEPHVRTYGMNMGHPEQKLIQDRGETPASRPGSGATEAGVREL
jgi:hypothetical protein